jgi:hypothetical protein
MNRRRVGEDRGSKEMDRCPLTEKFHIKHKIIGDLLSNMPVLNPNPPLFIPTSQYSLKQRNQLDNNYPGDFLWPAERVLMHNFMLSHDSGFS